MTEKRTCKERTVQAYWSIVGIAGGLMGSISDHARKGDVPAKRTYRVSEIADILGVSNVTAYRLIKEGHFRTVRIGSSIRVSKQSFDEWLDRETN